MTCWITASGPSSIARASASYPPWLRYSPSDVGSTPDPARGVDRRPAPADVVRHVGVRDGAADGLVARSPARPTSRPPSSRSAPRRRDLRRLAARARRELVRTARGTGSPITSRLVTESPPRHARRSRRPRSTRHARSSQTCTTVVGALRHAEHRVERRDAVGLGRRHLQALAGVVQPALADPADPPLQRVQDRQQERALILGSARDAQVTRRAARRPPSPVSGGPSTSSTAARSSADGSAVISFRSTVVRLPSPGHRELLHADRRGLELGGARFRVVRLVVILFVSTSSGKWNVMKARPGRSAVVTCTGASIAPRRETIRTTLPHLDPERRGVLGREVERLPAVQRRVERPRLHAGVVGLEPAPGREPERELVGQLVLRAARRSRR